MEEAPGVVDASEIGFDVDAPMEQSMGLPPAQAAMYPAPEATHDDVCADRELFMRLLEQLLSSLHAAGVTGISRNGVRVPVVAGQQIDVFELYRLVTGLGGLESVIAGRKWGEVCTPLNIPASLTSRSFQMRKIYTQQLHHFEQVYYHGTRGSVVPPPGGPTAGTPRGAALDAGGEDGEEVSLAPRSKRQRQGMSAAELLAPADSPSGSPARLPPTTGNGDADDADAVTGGGAEGSEPPPVLSAGGAVAEAGAAAAPAAAEASAPAARNDSAAGPPAKAPPLVAFVQGGGAAQALQAGTKVAGMVDGTFDCGAFVTLTAGGLTFKGILYSPGNVAPSGGGAGTGAGAAGAGAASPAGAPAVAVRAAPAPRWRAPGSGSRSRSRAADRDPSKPKAPKTAFNFYSTAMRSKAAASLPPGNSSQASKVLGEWWAATSEADRAPYALQAKADRDRYERELAEWAAENGTTLPPKSSRRRYSNAAIAAAAAAAAALPDEGEGGEGEGDGEGEDAGGAGSQMLDLLSQAAHEAGLEGLKQEPADAAAAPGAAAGAAPVAAAGDATAAPAAGAGEAAGNGEGAGAGEGAGGAADPMEEDGAEDGAAAAGAEGGAEGAEGAEGAGELQEGFAVSEDPALM